MEFKEITLYFLFLFSMLIVLILSYAFILPIIPKSPLNPSLTDEPWYRSPEWVTAIGTIGSTMGAVGIAAYSFKIGRENEKKQGLRYVFQLLDDNAHRNARRRIVNLYNETIDKRRERILQLMGVRPEDIVRKDALMKESEEMVKADFDQIGALISNKEVPKNDFIVIYWHEVLRCWLVLEDDIKNIRNSLNDNSYMINFERLKVIAEKYSMSKIKHENLSKINKKDIIVPPVALSWDRLWDENKISRIPIFIGHFDENLDNTTLNQNNIYIIGENRNKIKEIQAIIDYNTPKTITIKIKGKRQDSNKYYLFLSRDIKDINGIPLEKEIKIEIYY